ncbi:MAG: acyl-CoA dehydrogenase family protein [Chloroflexi bacterium]|nr:acyl-CoA dehydrogenase family protein [Chloroflexota bacterium]
MDFTIPADLDQLRQRVAAFVRDEVLPVEEGLEEISDFDHSPVLNNLREKARAAGLWAPHLPKEWGGLGVGPLGMALISQELGASGLAPLALNCAAPDEGNMHLLLHAATPTQLEKYLRPLAEGRARSCIVMTEKNVAGSDPTKIRTHAVEEGRDWVLNGEKWFISGANGAAFGIVMAITNPKAPPHESASLFLVDTNSPGWQMVREIPVMGTHGPGGHCEVRLEDVVVSEGGMLGKPGEGFKLTQVRLGPARLAHCMRWIGMAQRALDLAAERARQREAFGGKLADKQAIQWMLADSATELYASRLMVLHCAWLIESNQLYRQEISFAKLYISEALNHIVDRALQIFGSLGYSKDTPLERFYRDARAARIYDGTSEVHRMVIARNILRASQKSGTTKSATGGLA